LNPTTPPQCRGLTDASPVSEPRRGNGTRPRRYRRRRAAGRTAADPGIIPGVFYYAVTGIFTVDEPKANSSIFARTDNFKPACLRRLITVAS